ncbi:MAG: transglutaminase-like domain-containing protein [Candidatus Hermodarchaeota archaeon]
MENLNIYLQPTEFLDYNKKSVSTKAFEITGGLKTEKEKAIALFYWVRDKIKYNMSAFYMIKSNFKASVTLRRGYGFCVSKAVLLSSFARAVGIPARVHLADIRNNKVTQETIDLLGTNKFYFHGYSELFINNNWIKVTPVFDKNTASKAGFLPLVEFDGINDGILSKYDPDGNLFIEYLKDRGVFADLPYEKMDKVIRKKYYKYVLEKGIKTLNKK